MHTSFLSAIEKRVLVWMAHRLPLWVSPDLLTFIGLIAMIGIGICYYLSKIHFIYLIGASIGLLLNWFGDSMDGTVARVRKMQRPKYGYYLDHLVDAFGTCFMMLGLAYSGLITPILGIILLLLYLIMSINIYLATHTIGMFKISFAGFSPTEGRILLIIMNTILIFFKGFHIGSWQVKLLDVVTIPSAIFFLILTLRSAFLCLSSLDKTERAAWKEKKE